MHAEGGVYGADVAIIRLARDAGRHGCLLFCVMMGASVR